VAETMKSMIAGGSLGGLIAGLELRAAGLPVSIHERSERVLDDRGAGIVMQPETQQVLIKRCGLRAGRDGRLATIPTVSGQGRKT
jgi:2-polyprenyl-6-methoxyphenol hydroxylase-like FAD-dependent oxidoreductase